MRQVCSCGIEAAFLRPNVAGAVVIAQALKLQLEGLEAVLLANNQIGDVGGQALVEAVQACPSIVEMDIAGNPLSAEIKFGIEVQVFNNRFGFGLENSLKSIELQNLLHGTPPELLRQHRWTDQKGLGMGGQVWVCVDPSCAHCRAFVGSICTLTGANEFFFNADDSCAIHALYEAQPGSKMFWMNSLCEDKYHVAHLVDDVIRKTQVSEFTFRHPRDKALVEKGMIGSSCKVVFQ